MGFITIVGQKGSASPGGGLFGGKVGHSTCDLV